MISPVHGALWEKVKKELSAKGDDYVAFCRFSLLINVRTIYKYIYTHILDKKFIYTNTVQVLPGRVYK